MVLYLRSYYYLLHRRYSATSRYAYLIGWTLKKCSTIMVAKRARSYTSDARSRTKRTKVTTATKYQRVPRAAVPTSAAAIRDIVRKTVFDTKQKTSNSEVTLVENSAYTRNLLGNISVAAGESARVGDCINVQKIMLRVSFSPYNRTTTLNTNTFTYRVFIIKSNRQYLAASDAFSIANGAITQTESLYQTGVNIPLSGILDPDKCVILYDRTIEITPTILNAAGDGNNPWKTVDIDLPIGKGYRMQYDSPTSNYGKSYNLYMVVVGTAPFSSSSAQVGTCITSSVVNFIDSK